MKGAKNMAKYHLHLEAPKELIHELKIIAVTKQTTIRDIVIGLIREFIVKEKEGGK
jgi:hypothetical protein